MADLREGLMNLGPERLQVISELVACLSLGPENEVSNLAMNLLPVVGSESLPYLTNALAAGESAPWHSVAWLISQMGRDAGPAVPALVNALGHENPSIRGIAAGALGRIGIGTEEVVAGMTSNLEAVFQQAMAPPANQLIRPEMKPQFPDGTINPRMEQTLTVFVEAMGNIPNAGRALPVLRRILAAAPFPLSEHAEDAIRKIRDSAAAASN